MMNNMIQNNLFNQQIVEELINLALSYNRRNMPLDQLITINNIVNAADKMYSEMTKLDPQYRPLAAGSCFIKVRENEKNAKRNQGGMR